MLSAPSQFGAGMPKEGQFWSVFFPAGTCVLVVVRLVDGYNPFDVQCTPPARALVTNTCCFGSYPDTVAAVLSNTTT
jgi:hypothetical protein